MGYNGVVRKQRPSAHGGGNERIQSDLLTSHALIAAGKSSTRRAAGVWVTCCLALQDFTPVVAAGATNAFIAGPRVLPAEIAVPPEEQTVLKLSKNSERVENLKNLRT